MINIKKNFIYSIFLTLSQYLIGLVTFPYISRVLGVSNVGLVSFVDTTINYFVLFSTLGVSVIGAREVAKYRNDSEKLKQVFSSLITLFTMFNVIVVILYVIAVLFIPKLNQYKELFYIGTAKLIFTVFLVEWFYSGIENFKFITIRNLIIKSIYVCLLFLLVKNEGDVVLYFYLTTGSIVVNAFVNLLYTRKFVAFSFASVSLKPYFKQSLYLGSYSILTSMYTSFNVLYLGFVSDNKEVGYYWVSITLYSIILGFFTAFTGVMMPRMSSLLSQNNKLEFERMVNKSFHILATICFPLIIISIVLSPQIIYVLSGKSFFGAIVPMRIVISLILIYGVAQILATQVLVPMQKDKYILFASLLGAVVGISFNLILVKTYGSVGTAIVLLISEITVTSYYIYIITKNNILHFPWSFFGKNFLYSLPYFFICGLITIIFDSPVIILIVASWISMLYFIFINFVIIKNQELINLVNSMNIKLLKFKLKLPI